MPRPRRCRWISGSPRAAFFKPRGVPTNTLESVALTPDEAEALRLADLEQKYQEEAAGSMKISRSTFGRILTSARRKVAEALLQGKVLVFETSAEAAYIRQYGKEYQMKAAVTAKGPGLESEVDDRFGRCRYFVVVDPSTMLAEALENEAGSAGSGAGIGAAELVTKHGVGAVLTGNCGPNAFAALNAAGIRVFTGISGTVKDAVEAYQAGRLVSAQGPNAGAHSGSRRS